MICNFADPPAANEPSPERTTLTLKDPLFNHGMDAIVASLTALRARTRTHLEARVKKPTS